MSTTSGTAAKRAGMPLVDAQASPKRSRSSRHPSFSPSVSPSQSRSLAPSPSQSRSRSPAPRRSTSAPPGTSPARGATARPGTTTCAAIVPSPAGCTRSRAVEQFLRRNQQYGCGAFLLHHQVRAHERSCRHEPCFCPVSRCGFAGLSRELESHLATLHRWDVVRFRYGQSFDAPLYKPAVFCCDDYGELFHIVTSREGYGTALSMVCIRPDNACKQEFTYELKMPAGGRHRLQMQSTVWNTSLRYGVGEGSDVFLLVPDKLPGIESSPTVEVCINKVVAGAASN